MAMIIKSRRIGNIGKVDNLSRVHLRSPSKLQKKLRRIVVCIAKPSKYKHIKLPAKKVMVVLWKVSRRLSRRKLRWAAYGTIALSIVAMVLGSMFYVHCLVASSYNMPVGERAIIGQSDKNLMPQFIYDSKSQAYYLSKSAIKSTDGDVGMAALSDKVSIGSSSKDNTKFSLVLPANAQKGITTYDDTSNLSFTMIPQFSTLTGKQVAGHIVYPIGAGGPKAVYTVKGNGVQEDIVYAQAPKGTIKLSYKLKLPDSLQARMMSGGNLGIYSASPYLYGNISYGSATDEQTVQKARQKATKDNLVFVIPAPQLITSDGIIPTSSSRHLSLSLTGGDIVTITASGLGNLRGPISIDPSVIVTAASNFLNGGNTESDITYDTTNGQITEAGLTGADMGTWNANSPNATFPTSSPDMLARSDFGAVEYNGYIYVMGGTSGLGVASGGDCTAFSASWGYYFCNGVYYAPINSNGTIGSWAATTSYPTSSPAMPARVDPGAVAYNGYLYIVGGDAAASGGDCTTTSYLCNGVFSALICTGSNSGTGGCSSTAGTIGSWHQDTTATFPTSSPAMPARAYGATEAYNGYLYEMGGGSDSSAPAGGDCTSANGYYCNGTFYAPIESNGQVGAWTATTAFPTSSPAMPARDSFSAAVYNGYLYVMAGTAHSSAGDCTTTNYYCNGVFYAPISPNGSIGSWAATTAFPTIMPARKGEETVVYNGYLYVMGGIANSATYDCNYGSDDCAGVWYAPINSTGTIGSWDEATNIMATGAFPERAFFGAVAYNGYLYIMGGNSGAEYADCGTTTYVCNGVFYAQIDSAGVTGKYFTSSNTFTTAVEGDQVVAYNGYLYVMGGDAGGAATNTIYFAPINGDGSIGTLTTTGATAFTTVRTDFAAVAFNGYMYVLGGCNNTLALCATTQADDIATVYSSPIAAAGTLGAWTSTTSFGTGRYGLGAFVAPATTYTTSITGYMYIVGGVYYNGTTLTYKNDVQYGPITSAGLVSSWTPVSGTYDLNNARAFFGTAVYGGYVYVVGGKGASVYNNVEYAPISSSGGITSAFTVTTGSSLFTNARQGLGAVADNGYLYLAGGYNGTATYYADTQYAPINSNGSIGAWATATSFANASYGVGMTAYNGNIYIGGGFNGTTYYNDVYYAPVNNGGPGTLQTWTTMGTGLLNNVTLAGAAVYNNYIYLIGGWCGSCSDPTTNIQYVKINPNGSLATPWVDTTNLLLNTAGTYNDTYPVYGPSAVAFNGYLYAIGGEDYPTQNMVKVVEYALICTGNNNGVSGCNSTAGNVGTWAATTSLPAVSAYGNAEAYNGYMYDMGGFNSQYGNSSSVAVDYVLICTGSNSGVGGCSATAGTLGTWTATTSLPQATNNASGVIYDGYIYEIGGAGSAIFNSVYYALICNGSNNGVGGCSTTAGPIGTWYATTSIIFPTSYGQAVAYDGYLYDVGGNASAATAFTAVAPINNNGTIGKWTETASLPSVSTQDEAVVNDGFVYDLGEGSTGASPSWTVTYTGINAIPRIGLYTDYIDFTGLSGDDPTPIEMQTDGGDCSSGVCSTTLTNPNNGGNIDGNSGGIYVSYQFASNACNTFNNATTIPTLPNFLTGVLKPLTFTTYATGCTSANILDGRFMRVSIILDDSETATFPDSTSNHSSIADFTVWYHPAASNRLRGGTTFSNGALQTLDAPP